VTFRSTADRRVGERLSVGRLRVVDRLAAPVMVQRADGRPYVYTSALRMKSSASAADRVFLDCRGADIRVRRACRTRPVAPHGKADRGSRRRGERGARPGRPDAAGTQGRLLDGCRPDAWRPGVIRGRRKGTGPGIIQRARLRQAVRPPELRGGARQCVPGRRGAGKVRLPGMSAPRRAVTLSDTRRHGERAHCRRSARLRKIMRSSTGAHRSGRSGGPRLTRRYPP